jgi:hypothetical protein
MVNCGGWKRLILVEFDMWSGTKRLGLLGTVMVFVCATPALKYDSCAPFRLVPIQSCDTAERQTVHSSSTAQVLPRHLAHSAHSSIWCFRSSSICNAAWLSSWCGTGRPMGKVVHARVIKVKSGARHLLSFESII